MRRFFAPMILYLILIPDSVYVLNANFNKSKAIYLKIQPWDKIHKIDMNDKLRNFAFAALSEIIRRAKRIKKHREKHFTVFLGIRI